MDEHPPVRGMMMEKEYANRASLLKLREDIKMAVTGKEILQDKIESLILLFFEYIGERGEQRKRLEDLLARAFRELIFLESIMGMVSTRSDAFSVPAGSLGMREKRAMGIKLPGFFWEKPKNAFQIFNAPLKFDKTKLGFEAALGTALRVGEIENAVEVLSEEIKKTRKVVNSLENYILPEFRGTEKWIKLKLEEFAREDLFRYKMIKRKLELPKQF